MKRGSSGAKIPDLDEESDGGGGTTENMVDGGDDVDLEAVSLEQTTEKMDGGRGGCGTDVRGWGGWRWRTGGGRWPRSLEVGAGPRWPIGEVAVHSDSERLR
nr:hypothetical protein Iba_chr08cCG14400 [Ipomoea batatas]GMD28801.1 hypothetical protein Iba_chr08eCG10750 [Ipomoea batatas]